MKKVVKRRAGKNIMKIKTAYNSTYPKVAVQWLNQAFCFYQSLCLVDSEVLGNRHLRVAANRWHQALKDNGHENIHHQQFRYLTTM
jgi:hypothetical protein